MQNVLEDYIGHQRSKGARSDNSTAQEFQCNDLTIASQLEMSRGGMRRRNVKGRYEKAKLYQVNEEPVHKLKKP